MPTDQSNADVSIPILRGTDEDRVRRIRKVCGRLEVMFRDLSLVQSVVFTCVGALGLQSAEQDEEIGRVLTRCVDDKIHQQLKKLAKIIEKLGGRIDCSKEVVR